MIQEREWSRSSHVELALISMLEPLALAHAHEARLIVGHVETLIGEFTFMGWGTVL